MTKIQSHDACCLCHASVSPGMTKIQSHDACCLCQAFVSPGMKAVRRCSCADATVILYLGNDDADVWMTSLCLQ